MSIFQIYILTTKIVYVAAFTFLSAGFCFGETGNTLTPENVNPNQMAIHIDVWPKEILAGDCIYVLFSVKNKSQEPLTIQPLELFDNALMRLDRSKPPIVRSPDYPSYRFMGDGRWGEFRCFATQVVPGIVNIPPGETKLVFTDVYGKTDRTAYSVQDEKGSYIMRKVDEEPIELFIANFAEKYASCVQLPWPTLNVKSRPHQEEWIRIMGFLHDSTHDIPFRLGKFASYGKVETESGLFTMQLFSPAINFYVPRDDSDKNLPNLSTWREFEEKLSPGTLRDEIRLGRIQVQYLDGEKEVALNELRDWFAEMEPIQSMTLAASLCLPEGLEEESEKDELFKPVGTVKDEPEAHKHYMAMRREIDKIVSPYNTLPRRKLRDTNAY